MRGVPKILDVNFRAENRVSGHSEFRATLKSEELVRCIPLKTLYREDTPRLILNYSSLSNSLHVQKFHGVFEDSTGKYAVMEDLEQHEAVFTFGDVFQREEFLSTPLRRKLRLCYEVANTVAYLHSVNLVVKVISDSSIFVRFKNDDFLPVFSNLEFARSV
jgi:serine/threonine protein kinase